MGGWDIELELRERDRDYLGHVTAVAHLALFEEAHARWLAEIMDEPAPPFVIVHLELDYRRELLIDDGPVTVSLKPVVLTNSTVTVHERLGSAGKGVHTESRVILARWDRERRRSMPFPPRERQAIEALLDR
ncbi:thioesterase family protein [Actinomadura sp. KC216]|uniref:acyl-CoA thioesterase n=1 Tax=Actinomadura sp. KC216 TaxID=2530370 RepID=UPI001404582D|nr:thioesterase family protein [Actinomadura sp. KC216]